MRIINGIIICVFLFFLLSCDDKALTENTPCMQGRYIGSNCSGFIIQILDNSDIGKDVYLPSSGSKIKNSVIAQIDTSLAKTRLESSELIPKDIIFHFTYVNGCYPQKAFIYCPQKASIIITSISSKPCND